MLSEGVVAVALAGMGSSWDRLRDITCRMWVCLQARRAVTRFPDRNKPPAGRTER